MPQNKNSYGQILKATSIFGGVEVFKILIRIIRVKFIAVLLGPAGMGIAGLLGSTTQLISTVSSFGLGTSAVKDLASAQSSGNPQKVSVVVAVVRRLVWITGFIGAFLTFVFSSQLSVLTFGNEEYSYAFMWLAVTLLLNQISTGQNVLLRGMRQIKKLAKAGVIGSVLGLFTTIPFYYYYGVDGIVPGMIVSSIVTLLLTWYFARKIKVEVLAQEVTIKKTFTEGKSMLKMGFMLSLSGMITLGASYLVKVFISRTGGVDEVGLYTAGFSIISSYVGMIFTAMSTDYFPRLSAVANEKTRLNLEINQQAEIALLLLAPIITIFLIFIEWGVILLYSTKFLPAVEMILWAIIGILFKAGSWAVSFMFLAKGAGKLFFWNEVITNVYLLGLNVLGYYYWGLMGLGLSFTLSYILYLIQVFFVAKKKYDFSFNKAFLMIFGLQFLLCAGCLILVKLTKDSYTYIFGILMIIASGLYSLKELNHRLDLKSKLKKIKNKFNGRG